MNSPQRTACLAKGYTCSYIGNIMKMARGSDLPNNLQSDSWLFALLLKLHAGQDYRRTDGRTDTETMFNSQSGQVYRTFARQ